MSSIDKCGGTAKRHSARFDYILSSLESEVHSYRISSLRAFGLSITVRPSITAREVRSRDGTFVGYSTYTFDYFGSQPKNFLVRPSQNRLEVFFRMKWCSIESWLKLLVPQQDYNDTQGTTHHENKKRRWDQQARWWAANGKKFRLFDLPAEIRELVYRYSIGEAVIIRRMRRVACPTQELSPDHRYLGLLLTSRLTYAEASHILFSTIPFWSGSYRLSKRLFQDPIRYERIRVLGLGMTHENFFAFFGLQGLNDLHLEPSFCAGALKRMDLNRLAIDFASPCPSTSRAWLEDACQKSVIEWILESAAPFILRHQPELTGVRENFQQGGLEGSTTF